MAAILTAAGQQMLASQNFVTHTRIYVDDVLCVDTSAAIVNTPVISYQINRSRKLGAAKLSLNVANPGGIYSFKRKDDPIFGYGKRIKLQEGIPVGGSMEWFTRFTGIIVSQVPSNNAGKPALAVNAMDNMKLMLDYLPDDLYYCPNILAVKKEVLSEVPDGNSMHFRGSKTHLPWVDIPYPIFYKAGTKIKDNYEVDLINGEVYFGEKMCGSATSRSQTYEADEVNETKYEISVAIKPGFAVYRSFAITMNNSEQLFEKDTIPDDITVTFNGAEIIFSKPPFYDLKQQPLVQYSQQKIYVKNESDCQVTADYWYYDSKTNLAENVITDLALKAGFRPEQIQLEATNVSLKPIRFTNLTVTSAFEALQKIKQQLSPSYIITCDTEGNLRGYYTEQKDTSDYELTLIKKLEAPVSEENLYSVVVAHGVDLNPNDLRSTATAQNLLAANSVIQVSGSASMVLNKKAEDQISWHWVKKNNDTPPALPVDLLKISLAEAKKIEEINILVGDYNKGTIQQSMSIQVSEDGTNWFYVDRSSRGIAGASSQWLTVKGGELENRKIKAIKIIAEAAFDWTESHTYTKRSGFLGLGTKVKSDNYYHWYCAIKEVQIWEENTIAVTSSINNCIGIGDGTQYAFYIPNTPVLTGTVTVYKDGVAMAPAAYTLEAATGKLTFMIAPTGIITVATKQQPRAQSTNNDRYTNNITVINPGLSVTFDDGAIEIGSANYRLLKKLGLKKNALKVDNYLNSFSDVKKRGAEMLQEISRLEETLAMEVVYRPDVDICQTVGVTDALLGITGRFFIEELTESKQGFLPSLSIKVSNYS
ncbi:MAG: hypothetical protein H6Q72_1902 [Firmicutes bacterium]|nr:hypothetical protein [Bacillota bacterium]